MLTVRLQAPLRFQKVVLTPCPCVARWTALTTRSDRTFIKRDRVLCWFCFSIDGSCPIGAVLFLIYHDILHGIPVCFYGPSQNRTFFTKICKSARHRKTHKTRSKYPIGPYSWCLSKSCTIHSLQKVLLLLQGLHSFPRYQTPSLYPRIPMLTLPERVPTNPICARKHPLYKKSTSCVPHVCYTCGPLCTNNQLGCPFSYQYTPCVTSGFLPFYRF